MISQKCKNCEKEFERGVWLAPQFTNEKVYLFCSEKCKKEFLKAKINRIKIEYPSYYKKIRDGKIKSVYGEVLEDGRI